MVRLTDSGAVFIHRKAEQMAFQDGRNVRHRSFAPRTACEWHTVALMEMQAPWAVLVGGIQVTILDLEWIFKLYRHPLSESLRTNGV